MAIELGKGRPGRGLLVPALMVGAITASVVQAYRGYQGLETSEASAVEPRAAAVVRAPAPAPVVRPDATSRGPQSRSASPRPGGPEAGARWGGTPVSAPAAGPVPWPVQPAVMTARPTGLEAPPLPPPHGAGATSPAWSPVATPSTPPRPWSQRPRREGKSCGFGFG